MTTCFSLAVFKILSLIFDNLIIMCLSIDLFEFNLFGDIWKSWIWISISPPRFGKYSVSISLNKLSSLFLLSSGTPVMHVLVLLLMFYKYHRFSSLFSIFFNFLWLLSNDLPSSSLVFYSVCLSLMLKLYQIFQYIYCSLQFQDFCLVIYGFCAFVELLFLFILYHFTLIWSANT